MPADCKEKERIKTVFLKEAIVERLKWIGADKLHYRLITSYEIMHYYKPKNN